MRRDRSEERLHRALVAYLRLALPKPWLVAHVPNGGGRSKAEAGIFKAMGVLAGMPDLLVIGPYTKTPGIPRVIAIEVKAPPKVLIRGLSKARPRVSDAQRDVIEALGQCGIPTLIVNNLDEAVRALRELGAPLNGRVL